MTQKLIEAARNGNLVELEQLLTSGDDINFIGIVPGADNIKQYLLNKNHPIAGTALATALVYKNWDVAKFLLINGAKVQAHRIDRENRYYNHSDIFYLNAFLMSTRIEMRLDVFELIVKNAPEIHFGAAWSDVLRYSSLGYIFTNDPNKFLCYIKNNVAERREIVYFEALLRNELNLDLPLDKSNYGDVAKEYRDWVRRHEFNLESFRKYIAKREFNVADNKRIDTALNYLVVENYISKKTAHEIKELILSQSNQKLTIEDFPIQLQSSIQKPSSRTLSELIAEFVHFVYPEEDLPALPIDSTHLFAMDKERKYQNNPAEIERVRKLQTPQKLHAFLMMSETDLISRLYYNGRNLPSDTQNPAAVLLAEIVLYHANDVVLNPVGGSQPLLNKEQIRKALASLTTITSTLSHENQLILGTHWDQVDMMIEIQQENSEIRQTMEKLQQENSQMSKQIQTLMDTNKEILKALQNLRPDVKPMEPKKESPNLFRKN